MKRSGLVIGATLFLAAGGMIAWRELLFEQRGANAAALAVHGVGNPVVAGTKQIGAPAMLGEAVVTGRPLTAAEKAARVEKIKRDYDEIRAKVAADYTAAGALYPESVPAFLRQLALLEREKRADLAKVLSPEEVEAMEWRETDAAQRVQQWLGDTLASEAQRRAVFRLQRDFDERFALAFDLAGPALAERENARQDTQQKIRDVLGDRLFAAWLRSEGESFATIGGYVAHHHLPEAVALTIWEAKNEFTRRDLEIRAEPKMLGDQRREARALLVQQTEARLAALVGRTALEADRAGVFGWLPGR